MTSTYFWSTPQKIGLKPSTFSHDLSFDCQNLIFFNALLNLNQCDVSYVERYIPLILLGFGYRWQNKVGNGVAI